jgi:glycosyltransferase involved in cell wall biosynthesis
MRQKGMTGNVQLMCTGTMVTTDLMDISSKENKPTIVHLIPNFVIGGAEKVVIDIFDRIDRSRFSVRLMYWQDRAPLLEKKSYSPEEVIKLNFNKVISLRSIVLLVRELKRLKADLLQTHFMDPDLLGVFAARFLGIHQIMTIHSYPFPQKKTHCWRYRFLSYFADRIMCVSETVKKHVVASTGIRPEKISVVHNGINLEKFALDSAVERKNALRESLGITPDKFVIGNVSRLIEDKGHKYLLMAVPGVMRRFPQVKFLIVGDGGLRNELTELCRTLNITDHVVFAGSRLDVPALLEIMDIFVFPTFREALGICVLEAMAAGKPVIATNDAAVPELIDDAVEGLLVHPGDHEALEHAMIKMLDNLEMRNRMSAAAKKKVTLFTMENMARKIEEVYCSILNETR